ncbi:MAG: SCO family protein [Anaerolineae bacterium]|jgi:protein SCO1/2|nr:SCO family protein [Anaerolineales bacterium]MCC7512750.1 SCO family protein [Anaerolineae bacterium]OQY83043.1 MAG: hypothetical protein B6D40_07685 [Anaerolineae bacterium UTCFX3]
MDKKLLSVGVFSILAILLAAAVIYWFGKSPAFRGASYAEPFPAAPPIELTRADGSVFRLSDQRGRIVLLFFGYTSCPDVCPTTMAEMKQAMDRLGSSADAVRVVFVSVDPDRDTPERVQEYVSRFRSDFIGLTGTMEQLRPIWDAYGVFRTVEQSTSAMGYIVNHTARITLIDADGDLRLSYGFQTPVADIVHDIKIMLK